MTKRRPEKTTNYGLRHIGRMMSVQTLILTLALGCARETPSGDSIQDSAQIAGSVHGIEHRSPALSGSVAAAAPMTEFQRAVELLRKSRSGEFWKGFIESELAGWNASRQSMATLLREVYQQRAFRPVFLDGFCPLPQAEAIVQAIHEVPSHGLPQSPYRPRAIIALMNELACQEESVHAEGSEQIGDEKRLALIESQIVRTIYQSPRKDELVPEVVESPLEATPQKSHLNDGMRCLCKHICQVLAQGRSLDRASAAKACPGETTDDQHLRIFREVLERRQTLAPRLVMLDALLVQAFFQWVLDFHLDYRFHPFLSEGPVNRTKLPAEHREALIGAFNQMETGAPLAKVLHDYLPKNKYYDKLRELFVRYVEFMDAGPMPTLRAVGLLKQGMSGPQVTALQQRLAFEGYFQGLSTGQFDQKTHDAVMQYQKTHQLSAGGVVGGQTVESLNVPMSWRVRQLLVALGRWRESPLSRGGEPASFLRVNLPAFELQFVENGLVRHRHRVIVGSNRIQKDPLNGGVAWHLRRSKIFDTTINEIVFNPTWIVPEIIRVEEIAPKVAADSEYMAKNNFKEVGKLLVQGPGPANPLGRVKFNLAATDAIYLHDTDKPWLFKELIRDFSHGCIRVEKPDELAKMLLARQGIDAKDIDRRIADGVTRVLPLTPPVPIFIDYVTVDIDEEGQAYFFGDLYQYDLWYWKKRTPITRKFP